MTLLNVNLVRDMNCIIRFSIEDEYYITDSKNLTEIFKELYVWQNTNSDCFHSQLFSLISKADDYNKVNISKGFPVEVFAWYCWYFKTYKDKTFNTEKEFFDYVLNELYRENVVKC